ncbi:myomodulin neuropeptides 2-like [Mizuhopecten yessoensis]|uniref:Myomodulin n=1 Tax=Mizuhopecten yessoensis TaxID=6573 RepID=A0A210QDG7_MIZYE|nr:myomodulin neuropeptides 2-like [Mizuhopecten yessoensis]AXN93505.1 myomodulin [Mizuhopecten yessoensis]OWF46762.1 Myomodulin neuropeptide [Mizuhopecten yessoensis]
MKYILPIILLLHCHQLITGSTDNDNTSEENGSPLNRVRRGGLSMLRLGRGLQMLRLGKRSMPMNRIGRSLDTLSSDELKYLLVSVLGDKFNHRRQVPLPRYGREDREDAELQWLLEHIGSDRVNTDESSEGLYDLDDESPRQIRLAPRPGRFRRSTDEQDKQDATQKGAYIQDVEEDKNEEEKAIPLPRVGRILYGGERALPLPRLGRDEMYDYVYTLEPAKDSEDSDVDKRGMHMLRLGRGMNMLRLGKRPMSMLRLGRSEIQQEANKGDDKRSLSMLRLGKRLRMLRLGKRPDDGDRSLRMMRLGKKDVDDSGSDSEHSVETRGMHMLRLGRNVYK